MSNTIGGEKPWRVVRGSKLKGVFGNKELGDGVHFAYQFEVGGALTGMNIGKPARGAWRAVARDLCWTWTKPKSLEECYQVRQQEQAVRLFLDGQEVMAGALSPLVPANPNEVKP